MEISVLTNCFEKNNKSRQIEKERMKWSGHIFRIRTGFNISFAIYFEHYFSQTTQTNLVEKKTF